MISETFRGWPFESLKIPNGDYIICTYSWNGSEPQTPLYDMSHNIFRLNPDDDVVWRVQRDERGLLNWAAANKNAIAERRKDTFLNFGRYFWRVSLGSASIFFLSILRQVEYISSWHD